MFEIRELARPIIQAPMAGGISTPRLAAAVSDAGGLGFLAAGYREPEAVAAEVAELRGMTDRPFGLNVFAAGGEAADPGGGGGDAARVGVGGGSGRARGGSGWRVSPASRGTTMITSTPSWRSPPSWRSRSSPSPSAHRPQVRS